MSHIEVNHVNLAFGKQNNTLDQIELSVQKGEFIIILGGNGSGKSSLLKLIDGTYQPTSGDIFIQEKDVKNYSVKKINALVARLTQDFAQSLFCTLSVFENCLLAQKNKMSNKKTYHYFSEYLSQFNPNLPKKMNITVAALSGGEKQSLALALKLVNNPEILLLDEHTSALDPKTAERLLKTTEKIVRQRNLTCILTTHHLPTAIHYGDRLIALHEGKLKKQYTYEEKKLLTEHDLLEACY